MSISSSAPTTTTPTTLPNDVIKREIAQIVSPLCQVDAEILYAMIEPTKKKELGDFSIPVARVIPKMATKGNPAALAKEWSEKFTPSKYVVSASATGIYLNFKIDSSAYLELVLRNVIESKEKFGFLNLGAGKAPIVVEYSSPNIAKPFHAGHLRSTIIGNFVAMLYKAMGYDVVRINWLGDWGKQYGLLALGYQRYGDDEKLKTQPLRHLYEIYVKINKDKKAEEDIERARLAKEQNSSTETATETKEENEKEEKTEKAETKEEGKEEKEKSQSNPTTSTPSIPPTQTPPTGAEQVDCEINRAAKEYFKLMEEDDTKAIELWNRFRDMSVLELNKTYQRLNVEFDVITGESAMRGANVEVVEEVLKKRGLLVEKNGATVVDLNKWKLGDVVIRKKDGTTVYIARDIVSTIQRWEKYHFERMYYVVAASQSLHFQQMFKILELMGYEWANKCVHLSFGMVKGISTRTGTAIFLDDILDEAAKNMLEQMKANKDKMDEISDVEKIADVIGVSAVVVQDFNAKRIKDYDFDWKRMTSFEGHTGPYLQYAHARLCSILRKNADVNVNTKADLSLLKEPEAVELVTQISRFPEVLQVCLDQLEAVPLVMYLYELAYAVSMAHKGLWVKGRERSVAEARILLFDIARSVMDQGLKLIGLTPLERM